MLFCVGYLLHPFKEKDEFEGGDEPQDLIVLSPQWLMSVMHPIMELSTDKDESELSGEQEQLLERNGEVDLEVLKKCWKKFVSDNVMEIHHLCLILQAYCLIYPVHSITDDGDDDGDDDLKYIVPCKLPPKIIDIATCHWSHDAPQFSFCFDFKQFLPAEIYHRLICLATRDANPPTRRQKHKYSSNKCFFYNLEGTDWVMEMELNKQQLKIKVMYESIG